MAAGITTRSKVLMNADGDPRAGATTWRVVMADGEERKIRATYCEVMGGTLTLFDPSEGMDGKLIHAFAPGEWKEFARHG